MGNWIKGWIKELYTDLIGYNESLTKYGFICDLFDVVTYDDELTERWGKAIVDVMRAIEQQKTFEYIEESDSQYEKYLIVVNMLNRCGMLDWGGSIRGAWFSYDSSKHKYKKEDIQYLLYEFFEEKGGDPHEEVT